MKFYKEILHRNPTLTNVGSLFLALSIFLGFRYFMTDTQVLGINAMIKPLKFALSTWIYSWTLAFLLFYVENQKKVRSFSVLACVVMLYENAVITVQAFRGKISHFNQSELIGGILYAFMGIMIVWLTTATAVLTVRFLRQKSYSISPAKALSVKIALVLFVFFSYFGGYMSVINSHNVGGEIGQAGLPFLNWSTLFGDLRVAHFLGIHALQLIPLLGFYISNKYDDENKSVKLVWIISSLYLAFVCLTIWQALNAMPLLAL